MECQNVFGRDLICFAQLVYHDGFATRAEVRTAIFGYVETFYNRTRLHSTLDYLSPINFESELN